MPTNNEMQQRIANLARTDALTMKARMIPHNRAIATLTQHRNWLTEVAEDHRLIVDQELKSKNYGDAKEHTRLHKEAIFQLRNTEAAIKLLEGVRRPLELVCMRLRFIQNNTAEHGQVGSFMWNRELDLCRIEMEKLL
ncbi:hypothetical protein Acj133p042 [Acinetobacter phage 133]|uniref:Uncharacterized protein n=1 Tax=Acinetobacter phage 133 TaxID=2919552 RepID=D9I608_9CAUD|nr:hypothetical protein Acj133p042 [Acinetobacter phage 133]ADJ19389.1 hypothetical protein Acj133p042 [Acinetobacter phage 133]